MIELTEALKPLLSHVHSGKVRETFEVPDYPGLLLILATDRISTHNVVHQSQIPGKGAVLTAMTIHWLREVLFDFQHHLVASGREIYQYLPSRVESVYPTLAYRAIIVRRLPMEKSPVELIYRRHLVEAGSLFRAYKASKDPYGLNLPSGLPIMYRFDQPIFTPTDKSDDDDPLLAAQVRTQYPAETTVTAAAFIYGEDYLAERGIALLDSKFEASEYVLADEVLTSDSSRFARLTDVKEGKDPPWLDKQFVRDEAERMWRGKTKRPLLFPGHVVSGTASRMDELLDAVTTYNLADWKQYNKFDWHV